MKKALIRFPSIEAFKSVVYKVNRQAEYEGMDDDGNAILNPNNPRPMIDFTGTVKLHGTNAGVCSNGQEIWVQSKGNIITPEKDNQGFAFFVEGRKEDLAFLIERVRAVYNVDKEHHVAVYGEWCGKGIQKGVAINDLDKMFVIFKIKVRTGDEEENKWIDYDYQRLITPSFAENRIYFIQQFQKYGIAIDFNKPEDSQNKLIEYTNAVEAECPVGAAFGVKGIGEGIVWSGSYGDQDYIFKVKGEKHSSTKVKKLAAVDIEKINGINEFVEYAVTENRLEQAFDEIFTAPGVEVSKNQLGNLIKWVVQDVLKEELDTLVKNNLEPKDVKGAISKKTVKWFSNKYF